MSVNETTSLSEGLRQETASSFIGRQQEVETLRERLLAPGCRLLTLIGPGGIGKTRLAQKLIQEIWQHFPQGVYAVWLAPLHDRQRLAQAIVETLSLQTQPQADIENELAVYLRDRKVLLYLDNFEQLVEAAPLLTRLLDGAPGLQVLVTSRIALNLRYEWLHEVRGMAYDEADGEAQQLFIDRARLDAHNLTLQELQRIQQICQLVEGMPLAIELAAGWLRTLSLETIAAEIENGLDLLRTRDRDWEERHRSIRTVFDSSWKLLTDHERQTMQRFSLFCGGATAEALREVTGAGIDVLADLIDQSMLSKDTEGRYQINELLRQYAEEQFEASSDYNEGSARHAAYFLTHFMPQMEPQIKDRRHLDAMRRIDVDFLNVVTAWDYALDHADLSALDAALESLHTYTEIRERFIEGSTMLRSAAECAAQIAPNSRIACRLQTRWLRFKFLRMPIDTLNLDETLAAIAPILEVFERTHDLREQGFCWYLKGIAYSPFPPTSPIASEDAAIQAFDRALEFFQAVKDDFYTAEALTWSGCRFETDAGIERLQQALKIQQKIGEPNTTAWILTNLAAMSMQFKGYQQALAYLEQARAAMQTVGSMKGLITVTLLHVQLLILKSDFNEVSRQVDELMDLGQVRYPQGMKVLLGVRALIKTVVHNDYAAAMLDVEQSALIQAELVPIHNVSAWWGIATTACSVSDYLKYRQLFHELLASNWIFPGTESIWLMCEALALTNEGSYRRAAELLGASEAAIEAPVRCFDAWLAVQSMRETLRSQLGETGYETAIDHGMMQPAARLIQEMAHEQVLTGREAVNRQLVDPLTERELQVLDLIQQGLSNGDIAENLVIAVETVKVHARNIYSKLGVSGRSRAVEAARQLRLI